VTPRLLHLVFALCAICAPAWAGPDAQFKSDRFRVVYEKPKDPAHQALYEELKKARVLEKFRVYLSYIRLPRVLRLKLAGCDGVDNAWYDPEDRSITVCYEYLQRVREIAPKAPTPDGVTPENAFLGPLLEVYLHEIGHALFHQLRIPILGREEDAADQVAAVVLLHFDKQATRDVVIGVAWMYAYDAKRAKLEQGAFANVHGLDAQRFYNLLCLAYGAEPDLFRELQKKYLPESRAEGCEDEYAQVAYAMRTLMGPYVDLRRRDQVLARRWLGGKARLKTTAEERR